MPTPPSTWVAASTARTRRCTAAVSAVAMADGDRDGLVTGPILPRCPPSGNASTTAGAPSATELSVPRRTIAP
jgi:hypothetical protein